MRYQQQIDENDCGSACITIVVPHYGSHISIGRVRELSKTDLEFILLRFLPLLLPHKKSLLLVSLSGKTDALSASLPLGFQITSHLIPYVARFRALL